MEIIADFIPWVKIMRAELGQQAITIEGLANAFTESDLQLIRRDQAASLRILLLRVMEKVEDIKQMESAARHSNNKGAMLGAGAAFIFGSLFVAATRHKDAYQAGARLATSVLSRKVPFNTILIVIGKKGIPNDVKTISISRLARESNRSEPEIKAALKDKGYLLITPEQFAELLDKVERAVLDGSVCLPLARSEVMKQLTRR